MRWAGEPERRRKVGELAGAAGLTVTIEKAGDDALIATGELLKDLLPVLRKIRYKGQVFRSRPFTPRAEKAYELLKSWALANDLDVQDVIDQHSPD